MHKLIRVIVLFLVWLFWRLGFLHSVILWILSHIPYRSTMSVDIAFAKPGFHTSVGGNKGGLGDWERLMNSLGIPFVMKGADSYGEVLEALRIGDQYGVENWTGFRYTKASGRISREVPNYTVDPAIDAPQLCQELIELLPPEFDKRTALEPINEPRDENAPGDTMWQDMNATDYLGLWCLEAAEYLNARGYKFVGPSFNSGRPGREGHPINDAVEQYSQPHMLEFLQYCADNPDMAFLGVHDYSWSLYQQGQTAKDWYPQLWGRWEAAIAAADLAGIPRTFKIVCTEFGFAHTEAPRWSQVESYLDDYFALTARFPQFIGVASWTLQLGWGDISNDVITWTQYPPAKEFPMGEQPARTSCEFGHTLPSQPPEPPPGDCPEEKIFELAQSWAFPLNTEAALQKKLLDNGYLVSGEERWEDVDGTRYAMQPGALIADTNVKAVSYAVVGDWENVKLTDGECDDMPPPSGDTRPPMKYRPCETTRITQKFGVNAPNYPIWGSCGHEGIDTGVAMGHNFYATEAGTVVHASDRRWGSNEASNWGWHVVLRHTIGNATVHTLYAHAAPNLPVSVGDTVKAGDVVGVSGNTGVSTGYHLHYSILVDFQTGCHPQTTYGWFVDPEYVMALDAPGTEPPPTGREVDMVKYFWPQTGVYRGDIVIKKTSWGAADVREQLLEYDGDSWLSKGTTVEIRKLIGDKIFLTVDTSPRENVLYVVDSETGWLPSVFREGSDYIRTEVATFYHYGSWGQQCQPTGEVLTSTNAIRFKKFYETYLVPESGLTFQSVVHLQWLLNGAVEEEYWVAPGLAYVRWHSVGQNRTSWAHEVIPWADQAPNEVRGTCANPPR